MHRNLFYGFATLAVVAALAFAFAGSVVTFVASAIAAALFLFTPKPVRWSHANPRSIFETRRLGLA